MLNGYDIDRSIHCRYDVLISCVYVQKLALKAVDLTNSLITRGRWQRVPFIKKFFISGEPDLDDMQNE